MQSNWENFTLFGVTWTSNNLTNPWWEYTCDTFGWTWCHKRLVLCTSGGERVEIIMFIRCRVCIYIYVNIDMYIFRAQNGMYFGGTNGKFCKEYMRTGYNRWSSFTKAQPDRWPPYKPNPCLQMYSLVPRWNNLGTWFTSTNPSWIRKLGSTSMYSDFQFP